MGLFLAVISLPSPAVAQTRPAPSPYQKLPADTVIHLIRQVTQELRRKHPGFYRYHSQATFAAYIDSVKTSIKDSLTVLEAFRKMKPIISRVGCLHTDLGLSKEQAAYLNQGANLFPLQLYFIDDKVFVKANYSTDKTIAAGDELLSINGKPLAEIVRQLLPGIPSDGYNQTMK